MNKNVVRRVLIYSAKPPTIFYPFPVLPILIVEFAGGTFTDVIVVVAFTSLFYSALNLWNHVNDYKEDYYAGKDTPFTSENVRKITVIYVLCAYTLSAIIISTLSRSLIGKVLFLVVLILTFLYSDNMITKLRLKKHYATEILTYLISIPSFILVLYDLIKPIDLRAIVFSLTLLPFVISTVFIKDLKDISEDKKAGWKTLGVVFEAETLIKVFFYLNFVFYVAFAAFSAKFLKISPILPLSFSLIPIYYIFKNIKTGWKINLEMAKSVQNTVYAGFVFIVLYILLLNFK